MQEQGPRFKKSSRSEDKGACVELAVPGPGVAVRDSKHVTGPVLQFKGSALLPFIGKIKAGGLDLPS
jgi:hypothetical protein